jgi:hypothetical protein
MNVEAATGAARRLAVDVANVTFQLAMLQASTDMIREAVSVINPDMWLHGQTGIELSETRIILTTEQAIAVSNLVAVINDVLM